MRWADPELVTEAVRAYAADLRRRRPDVTEIYWYGSWVSGTPTASSDVDLCVVVETDPRRPRDRLPDFLPSRFPVGIDLAVVTRAELDELARRAPSRHEAIVSGRRI